MKKLNEKSFYIMLGVLIAYVIMSILSLIQTYTTDFSTLEIPGIQMTDENKEAYASLMRSSAVFGLIVSGLIFAYFLKRILKNRKVPQGQKYVMVLLVFSCINVGFSAFSIASSLSDIFALIVTIVSLIVYSAMIVACVLQRKYVPPYDAEMAAQYAAMAQNPYGAPQNPYGAPQNPYGAPQNPYGAPQNPYGAPQDPYGAPQNPYGAPQNDPSLSGSGNPFEDFAQKPEQPVEQVATEQSALDATTVQSKNDADTGSNI